MVCLTKRSATMQRKSTGRRIGRTLDARPTTSSSSRSQMPKQMRLLAAVTNGDTAEAKAVSALARAIKELGSVQGFVFGDYDKREREARIAALQARTEKDDGPDEIRLVIEGEGYEQS